MEDHDSKPKFEVNEVDFILRTGRTPKPYNVLTPECVN